MAESILVEAANCSFHGKVLSLDLEAEIGRISHIRMTTRVNKRAIVDPSQINDGDRKLKAVWNHTSTECFVQVCLEQVTKGERSGATFTKKGWKCIISKFEEMTGKKYDKSQLKNRYDSLRKEWRAWYNLFGKETGLGWDPMKNTVDAPAEWWERKQLENPLYGKFRDKGLPFAPQLTMFFKDVVANGEFMFAPSYVELLPNDPNDDEDGDDGSHPCLNMEEGSGDSEDASVGATQDFANIGMNSSQRVGSQKSGEKRKRTTRAQKSSKKGGNASKLVEVVSVIAETVRSRNDAANDVSIGEVMAELQTLDELNYDLELHTACCDLMVYKPAREIFMSLKGYEAKRMHWLKHAANNPFPFMQQQETS